MAGTMSGLDIMRGLIQRGYSPYQAAALAGHALQESGGDPTNVNAKEGAHGLWQWRNDRWQGLQNFAKSQGRDPNDPEVQMDWIGREMQGPEARAGRGFMASTDVASASAALKPYIRFGDNSAGTRLNNAVGLLSDYNGSQAAPTGPLNINPVSPAPVGALAPAPAPAAVAGAAQTPAPAGASGAQLMQGGMKQLQQQPDFLPFQQIQPAAPANPGQSSAIAQALAKSYGWA